MSSHNATLKINSHNAIAEWGLVPTTGLMASLLTPPPVKDAIQSTSRLEHGTRTTMPTGSTKLAKREFSLEVGMRAPDLATFHTRYAAFIEEITRGWVNIETSLIPGKVFRCRYISCTQFTNYNGRLAKFILKFEEPNPNNR